MSTQPTPQPSEPNIFNPADEQDTPAIAEPTDAISAGGIVVAETVPKITLAQALDFAKSNNDLSTVCRGLTQPIDAARFAQLSKRIDTVVSSKWINTGAKKRRRWNSQQNRLKGRLFEQLLGVALESCTIFSAKHSVQTSTNELDWLVMLGPFHVFVPVMRTWGTHFICECKMTKSALDANWVARLYALTQTHHTRVALLVTAKDAGNKGNNSRSTVAIREFSLIPFPAYILRISLAELETCVALQRNLLELISEKYLQIAVKSDRLQLVAR